jgi:hypothetical protein
MNNKTENENKKDKNIEKIEIPETWEVVKSYLNEFECI